MIDDLELVHCSGNVWRDVGYADADLRRATSVIAGRIVATLNDRGLSMRQAAKTIGFAAADYSRVRNARLWAVRDRSVDSDAPRP